MTFIKGQIPWNKNIPFSDEVRKKISDSKKGKPNNSTGKFKKGQVSPNKGKKLYWMTGENNNNWGKFGKNHPCYKEDKKHKFHKLIRETFKYRQWRSDVFTRDNFTCQKCLEKGCYLEAHHIKRFIDIIEEYNIKTLDEALNCEELWNINNGITLCNKCHRNTDTWGRRSFKISSD
jgi:5-methylcytosine-specific restriction endonuclease McrA